jgi:DNA replication protein DnaC
MTQSCPLGKCDGSGFIIVDDTAYDCECRAERQRKARSAGLTTTIPKRYAGISFERPPVPEIARIYPDAIRTVRQYLDTIEQQLDQGKGLWFSGNKGTGKTTLAMLVSKTALQKGRSVAIYSMPTLLAIVRETFNDASKRSYIDLYERLTTIDLLHLDDLGTEKSSEWVLEQLYSIINARYEQKRAVVITTNLGGAALEEQITDRTVSRLLEMCGDPLWMLGEDMREQLVN